MRAALAFVLGVAVAVAIGCGKDGTIPRDATGPIKDHLQAVEGRLNAKDCAALPTRIDKVQSDITNLGERDVPQKLLRNLQEGLDQLSTRATAQCRDTQSDAVKTIDTATEETPTIESTPTSTPEETTPVDTGDESDTGPTLTDTPETTTPSSTQPSGGFAPTGAGGAAP